MVDIKGDFKNLIPEGQALFTEFIPKAFKAFEGTTPGQGLCATNSVFFAYSSNSFIPVDAKIPHVFINWEDIQNVKVMFVDEPSSVKYDKSSGFRGTEDAIAYRTTYYFNAYNNPRLLCLLESYREGLNKFYEQAKANKNITSESINSEEDMEENMEEDVIEKSAQD